MENKKPKKKINGVKIGAAIVSTIVGIGFVGLLVALVLLMNILESRPQFDVAKFDNSQSSKIFDQNDKLIATVGAISRDNVKYAAMPNSLIDSFVATEDSRFFVHNGFDLSRFTKSFLDNIIGIITRRGGGLSGGSTFTMQLVKNSYFTDDSAGVEAAVSGKEGIKRKFQEISLAMELEKNISKKNIIELYINKMNYGANGRGVENAARYYFNKNTSELNISEVALLVGTVNSPYYYNPFNYLDAATSRRDNVLYLMKLHGYISDKEYKLAKSIKVEDLLANPYKNSNSDNGNQYQAYIDVVIAEAEKITGISPYTTSMNIYTHMKPEVQKTMDTIQANGHNDYVSYPDELIQNASVAIDNYTGAVVGILGGRNYAKGGALLLNHATDQFKQPGSSIKTILEYPLAFEKLGWSTSHMVNDKPTFYKGTDIMIGNVTGTYEGQLTLKSAVAQSLNTVAINTLQEVIDKTSNEEVISYLNKMGYNQVNDENFNVQYAIGGSTLEVTVMQQAAAQAAIVGGGVYHKPHTIKKIIYADGRTPLTPTYEGVRTLSPAAAFQTTELLKNNVLNGTTSWAYSTLGGFNNTIYAKSGTSNWGEEGAEYDIPDGASKDIWVVASDADYTVAVWTGYEKAVKGKDTYFDEYKSSLNLSGRAAELILSSLGANEELNHSITPPNDVTSITHILGTYPYASTISGMDNKYIANGYIATKFASLVAPEQLTVERINNFNSSIDNSGNVKLNWEAYPNPDKLKVASASMDIGSGYTGKRIFDYSWVFGPIRYKARINVNGQTVKNVISESNSTNLGINLEPGSKVSICGYYGYQNKEINSKEICNDFLVEDKQVTINYPNANSTEEFVKNWANENNINISIIHKYSKTNAGTKIMFEGIDKTGSSESIRESKKRKLLLDVIITKKVHCPVNQKLDEDSGQCY